VPPRSQPLPLIRDADALMIVIPEFRGTRNSADRRGRERRSELIFATSIRPNATRTPQEEKGTLTSSAPAEKCLKWLEEGKPLRLLEMTAQELQAFSASFPLAQTGPCRLNCDAIAPPAELPPPIAPRHRPGSTPSARRRLRSPSSGARFPPARPSCSRTPPRAARARSADHRALRIPGLITFYPPANPSPRLVVRRGATASRPPPASIAISRAGFFAPRSSAMATFSSSL